MIRNTLSALAVLLTTSAAAYAGCDMPSSEGRADLYGHTSSRDGIDKLNADFRDRLAAMMDAANARFGGNMAIFSGYRSTERQAELWEQGAAKYPDPAERRKWIAPPGSSMHEFGLAVDMTWNGQTLNASKNPQTAEVVSWLRSNASSFGLSVPLGNEDWHVEPLDARKNKEQWIAGIPTGECADNYMENVSEAPPVVLMPWNEESSNAIGS